MEVKTIIWIFISIFSLTAVITLLGIANILKGIKAKYLNKLFYTLIVEVVIAVMAVFKGVDFQDSSIPLETVIEQAEVEETFSSEEQRAYFIVEQLKLNRELQLMCNRVEELERKNRKLTYSSRRLENELATCNSDLNAIEKNFFSKITKLRGQITNYSGFINLNYNPEEKKEVFETLSSIFEILGYLNNGDDDIKALKKHYIRFEKRNGIHIEGELIVDEYDTAVFIREYLNKSYPVN